MLIYMFNNWLLKFLFISCVLRACVNQLQSHYGLPPIVFQALWSKREWKRKREGGRKGERERREQTIIFVSK